MADVRWGEQSATARVLLSAVELLQDLQVLDGRFLVWGTICHSSSTAELLLGPAGPGWQMCGVGSKLPLLSSC